MDFEGTRQIILYGFLISILNPLHFSRKKKKVKKKRQEKEYSLLSFA